jgi:hypothetical protein
MSNIFIYRFSKDGFNSYYQNHHADGLELGLKKFKEKKENYPKHLLQYVEKNYSEVIPEWREFTTGVFAFAGNIPNKETTRILLNHLSPEEKKSYQWWSAEIDDEQYCFDIDNNVLWKSYGFKKVKEIIKKNSYEIFLPKQFLNIKNIQNFKF